MKIINFQSKRYNKFISKKEVKRIRNRGSEMLQTVLISGIILVLVVTIFYPQMKNLFTNMMDQVTTWFDTTGSKPFTDVIV